METAGVSEVQLFRYEVIRTCVYQHVKTVVAFVSLTEFAVVVLAGCSWVLGNESYLERWYPIGTECPEVV